MQMPWVPGGTCPCPGGVHSGARLWQPLASCLSLPGTGHPRLADVQASTSKPLVELHEGIISHAVVYPQAANIADLPKIITAFE